jgi:rhamnosyltransferase
MKEIKSIGVIIPTWNSKHHLEKCLPPLLNSNLNLKILCIDSSSNDGTIEFAQSLGIETLVIKKEEFNHGLTREKARRHIKTDIIVMMTDDAYALDNSLIENLTKPLLNGTASIAYARQLPRIGSGFFESFPREFNYPADSHVRSIFDVKRFGVYTFFCSNSCAAYLNSALNEIGGFPNVLFGEDTVCTAKLLRKGHKIAYVAEARVRHSHNYSLTQEFIRYYAIGKARKSYQHLLNCEASDNRRGASLFKEMIKRLIKYKPYLIPYAFLHTGVKFIGYHLGKLRMSFYG